MGRRAAGFLLYRKFESEIQYLLLKASYGNKHWTPPKGIVYYWKLLNLSSIQFKL